jgi:hypothetical protein
VTFEQMYLGKREGSEAVLIRKQPCRVCGKEAKLLPAGTYRGDASTWLLFDNQERRGWRCSDPDSDCIFGAPVGTYNGDPAFALKRIDEALGADLPDRP